MNKQYKKKKPRVTREELGAKITQHIEALATATDEALVSSVMGDFLDSCAKFHKYSPGNQFLIQCFHPGATFVAGYNDWKTKHKRYVTSKAKGKGIPILAPNVYKTDRDDPDSGYEIRGFRVVYVYDVSLTDGEPLPPTPDWKSPEMDAKLSIRLTAFATEQGIEVEITEQHDGAQGRSLGGKIQLDPSAGTKTFIHELAHELLHKNGAGFCSKPPKIRELEAEAVGYVVATHFGISSLASPNYIALNGATSEEILAHMKVIRDCATCIIKAIEEKKE